MVTENFICKIKPAEIERFIKIKNYYDRYGFNVKKRGRHPNRRLLYYLLQKQYRRGTQNDVPIWSAEEWALYAYPKKSMYHGRDTPLPIIFTGEKMNWKEIIQ